MTSPRINQVENYVKEMMASSGVSVLAIGHDFKHVDRVRHSALKIATGEGFQHLEALEIAALLHDIGLPHTKEAERNLHGPIAAEMAADFLAKNDVVTDAEQEAIIFAIRHHNAAPSVVDEMTSKALETGFSVADGSISSERNALLKILRDADMLDALGAVGLMRAFTSKSHLPEYDPRNIKGETWGLNGRDFDESRAAGWVVGRHIIDQINFQILFFDYLHTPTARRIAEPLVEFMKAFVLQLEAEIS